MPSQPTVLICGSLASMEEACRRLKRAVRAHVAAIPDLARAAERLRRRRPAVVVLAADGETDLVGHCRQVKRLYGAHTPLLVVTPPSRRHAGIQCLREVADSLHVGCMGPESDPFASVTVASRETNRRADPASEHTVTWDELVARVQALLRHRRRHDALRRECNRLERQRQHIEAMHARLDQDLSLARKLQRSFLPRQLPEVGAVRFATRYFPVGPVAGDIYDIFRLDENTLGFYVADAVGHGVAAALLTAFVKKAIRPKIISGHSYEIVEPGDVLTSLNREMLSEELHESSFVTMVYGIVDVRTHRLRYSLAGHPPAIRMSGEGDQEFLNHSGPLLGVMDDEYTTQTVELSSGDKVVLYSDGIDEARHHTGHEGSHALWVGVAEHADLPVDRLLDETLRAILPEAASRGLRDDLTLVALEILRD